MIANYGYQDGSGIYYIRIDTDACVRCAHACVVACTQGVFERVVDDYDDAVVQVADARRRTLASDCAACKPAGGYVNLPCVDVCEAYALQHSW
ncbi:MAG: hypothetical protein KBD60_07625 [Sterolibacterium sp.]|jgi:Fe-S-cluster-containing hydrogenase component 2|nr:hypothetical protein [Sterolibacterium sp.]